VGCQSPVTRRDGSHGLHREPQPRSLIFVQITPARDRAAREKVPNLLEQGDRGRH